MVKNWSRIRKLLAKETHSYFIIILNLRVIRRYIGKEYSIILSGKALRHIFKFKMKTERFVGEKLKINLPILGQNTSYILDLQYYVKINLPRKEEIFQRKMNSARFL